MQRNKKLHIDITFCWNRSKLIFSSFLTDNLGLSENLYNFAPSSREKIFMIPQKKYVLDLRVKAVQRVHERYVLIRLTDEKPLPPMLPGQFVEVRVDGSPSTFLRRPISINFVDYEQNELWLLVATVGDGTRRLAQLQAGDRLNCVLPLGNGFSPLTPFSGWRRRRGAAAVFGQDAAR